jgi:hypothetical protein
VSPAGTPYSPGSGREEAEVAKKKHERGKKLEKEVQ